MALTVQVDGSVVGGNPNTIHASWFNDYRDLLTGTMTDQDISPKADLILAPIGGAPGSAPSVALASGTTLGVGVYKYVVTFSKQGQAGESLQSAAATITTTTNNQKVSLTAIPTGPTGTTARNLYRTVVGGSVYKLLHTISDNTTTTYADTTADGSLGSQNPPTANGLAGRIILKDSTGTIQGTIYSNGYAALNGFLTPQNNATGLTFKDNGGGQVEFDAYAPAGTSRGIIFAGYDGTSLHQGIKVNTDGTVTMTVYDSALATTRAVRVFIGTTDPSTYLTVNEGDIWIDA